MLQSPGSPLAEAASPLDTGMISSKRDVYSPRHSLKEDIIHIDSLARLRRPRKIQDTTMKKDDVTKLSKPSRSRQIRYFEEVDKEESPTEKHKEQVRSRLRHRYSRMRTLRDLGVEPPMNKAAVTLPPGIPANLILKKPLPKQRSEPALVKRILRTQKSEPVLVKQKSRIQAKEDDRVDCGDGRAPAKKGIKGSVPCGADSGKPKSEAVFTKQKSEPALVKQKSRIQAKKDNGVYCGDGDGPAKKGIKGSVPCGADSSKPKSEAVFTKQKSEPALVKQKSRIQAKKDNGVYCGDGDGPAKKGIKGSVPCGADSRKPKSEAVFTKQKSEPALVKQKSGIQAKKDNGIDCGDGGGPAKKGIKGSVPCSADSGIQKSETVLRKQKSEPALMKQKSEIQAKKDNGVDYYDGHSPETEETMGSVPCLADSDQDSSTLINPNTTLVVDQDGTTHIKPKYSLKKKLDIDCLVGLRNIQAGITDIDEDASLLDDGVLQFSIRKTKEMKNTEYWHQDMLT